VAKKGQKGKADKKPLVTPAMMTEGKRNLEAAKGTKEKASKEKMMDVTATPSIKKNRANGMTPKMTLPEDSDEEDFYEDKVNSSLEDTDDEVEVIGIKKSKNTYEEDGWSTEEEVEFAGT